MNWNHMTLKRYFLTIVVFVIVAGFFGLFALCIAIGTHGGSDRAAVAIYTAVFAAVFTSLFSSLVEIFARKFPQPPNYPRIKHLRIAGKYTATGAAAVGVSPLHIDK
ncbi:MAG: hypothetical protein LAN59_11120 [Acidobacteriia bacterium]|nr:hypothetical protein [Terriglobia bacterium]